MSAIPASFDNAFELKLLEGLAPEESDVGLVSSGFLRRIRFCRVTYAER